jgi:hypothetical protein
VEETLAKLHTFLVQPELGFEHLWSGDLRQSGATAVRRGTEGQQWQRNADKWSLLDALCRKS